MTEPNYSPLESEMERDMTRPLTWRTRDGREILIAEMGDAHLVNTIKLLRRRADAFRMAGAVQMWAYAEDAPDGAAAAAEMGAEHLLEWADDDEVVAEFVPSFPVLLKEAERRGIACD